MSGVEEILSYKKNPAEDFYALLNCNENSSVSRTSNSFFIINAPNFPLLVLTFVDFPGVLSMYFFFLLHSKHFVISFIWNFQLVFVIHFILYFFLGKHHQVMKLKLNLCSK